MGKTKKSKKSVAKAKKEIEKTNSPVIDLIGDSSEENESEIQEIIVISDEDEPKTQISSSKPKKKQKTLEEVKAKVKKNLEKQKLQASQKTTKFTYQTSTSEKQACRKDAIRKMSKIKSDGRTHDQSAGQDRPQPIRTRKSCKEKNPHTGELYSGKLVDREKGKLLHSRHHAKQPEHDEDWDVGREYEYLRPGSHSR